MKNLVSESLDQYIEPQHLNELDPETAQAAAFIAGGIGAAVSGIGITYLMAALEKSKSKTARKLGKLLGKTGAAAAEGTRKGPNTNIGENFGFKKGRKLNEVVDPALVSLATYMGTALGGVIAAGGITLLMNKLAKSKDPKARKFGEILGKLGSSAAEGTKKAPPSI